MINCPNPNCKATNPEGTDACQTCQWPLPHYYLWGVGDLVATLRPGALLHQRYLLKRDRTFLDTKPGILPESLPEIPDFLLPYLHLSAYPLHVPRPYSVLRTPDKDYVVMLESGALSMAAQPEAPGLLPKLVNRWADAPPLRQLNWLWQIAQLWDSFAEEQVAATLLDPEKLRVDGSIVRLLELTSPVPSAADSTDAPTGDLTSHPPTSEPTLLALARSWNPLVKQAHQANRAFLQRLCEQLEKQTMNAEQLCEQLSQAITVCGQGQGVTYDMAVYTDQGPTRKRNEDACFPESGTELALTSDATKAAPQLLIVCDGIGGHQGGDVASKLAIATIQKQLEPILSPASGDLTSTEVTFAIESAICAANDEISAQNDMAQRQARDRMGTTLVLALVRGADIYIAHLGDSRAYRVSGRNCQQVTLDDDVASRQMRLGGSLYREVLVQPGAGSLIQALGMGPSQALRPTVQRFVLDENCVFLLCSDGLSDSDRVEQFWRYVLKPMVIGKEAATQSAAAVGQKLVSLANKYNGHDNVTVGLLNAQVVRVSDRMVPRDMSAGRPLSAAPATAVVKTGKPATTLQSTTAPAENDDSDSTDESGSGRRAVKVGIAVLLLSLLAGLAYALVPGWRDRFNTPVADAPSGSSPVVIDAPGTAVPTAKVPIEVGEYARVQFAEVSGIKTTAPDKLDESEPAADAPTQLSLYTSLALGVAADPNEITYTVPSGGIVQILNTEEAGDTTWVQLQLCSIPSGDSLTDVPAETDTPEADAEGTDADINTAINVPESTDALLLETTQTGWIDAETFSAFSTVPPDLTADQKKFCES